MAKHSRTWWGQKFISALESFTDSGRLQRGRAYSGDSRILHFDKYIGEIVYTFTQAMESNSKPPELSM